MVKGDDAWVLKEEGNMVFEWRVWRLSTNQRCDGAGAAGAERNHKKPFVGEVADSLGM